jgi:hypothetical protein
MAKGDKLHDVNVKLVHETPKAWLVDDGSGEEWFPKSVCELEPRQDGTWDLTAPEWLLKDKGFI